MDNGYFHDPFARSRPGGYPHEYPLMFGMNGHPQQYPPQIYGPMGHPAQHQTYGRDGYPLFVAQNPQMYGPSYSYPAPHPMFGWNGYHPHIAQHPPTSGFNFSNLQMNPSYDYDSESSEEDEVEPPKEAEQSKSKLDIDPEEFARFIKFEEYCKLQRQSAGSEDATSKLKELSLQEDSLPKGDFAKIAKTKFKSNKALSSKPLVSRSEIVRQLSLQTSKPAKGRKVPELTPDEVNKWVFTQMGVSEKADLCLFYYKRPRRLTQDKGVGFAPQSLYALQEGCTKVARGKVCYHQHSLIVCSNLTLKELSSLKQVKDLLKISFKVMAVQGFPSLDFEMEYKELQDRWQKAHGQPAEAKAKRDEATPKPKPVQRTAEQERQDRLNETRSKPLRNYRADMSNNECITDEELVVEEKLVMRLRDKIGLMLKFPPDSAEYAEGLKSARDLVARANDTKNKLVQIATTHVVEVTRELQAYQAELAEEQVREEELVEQLKLRLRHVLTFPEGSSEYKDGIKAGAEIVARCKDPANKLSHVALTGRHAIEQEVQLILTKVAAGETSS